MLPSPSNADATADGLTTLRNGLRLADRFGLFVAVANRHADRDTLIRELTASVPDLTFSTVRLTASATDILDDVLQQAGNPPTGPVMVVDFDAAIPSDATYHPILQALNLRRPEWPKVIPHPVIFWVPEYVFTLLAREAPDFLDWRSLTVFFTDTTERDLIPLRSEVWDGGANNSFTRSERLARIVALESRLALHESERTDRRILSARCGWLNEVGLHHRHLGETQKALASFNECLTLSRQSNNRQAEGAALGNLATVWRSLGDARKAITFYEQRLAIAREIGDRRGEGNDLGGLGITWRVMGDARKAASCFEQALVIAREIGDGWGEGNALGNLGNTWINLGSIRKAAHFYEQHLTVAREIGDRRGEENALGGLGIAWADLGDTRKAITFHEQALAIALEIGNRQGEGRSLDNLGTAWRALGDARKAVTFHEQALAIALEIGDRWGERTSLSNLGAAWADLGDARKAVTFHEQHLAVAHEIGDRHGEARASYNMALALDTLGRHEEAVPLAEHALAIFAAIESPHAEMVRRQLAEWRGEVAS